MTDGTLTCPVTLSSGAGSCQITETAAGPYSFTASYGGDTNDASSNTSSSVGVTVLQDDTTASITGTTPGSPVVGQPITVDVAVTADLPGAGTPTGTVTVSDGGSQSCPATLSAGVGSCQIIETSVGGSPYSFTASYGGDSNDAASPTSGPATVTVGPAATTTLITSTTPDDPVVGQPITIDVSVGAKSPGAGTPTGSVMVKDGGTKSCDAPLTAGTGSCQITETTASEVSTSYKLIAEYNGDSNYSTSDSTATPVVVGQDETTTTITETSPSNNVVVVGQPLTVTVSVSPISPGSGTPTGNVTVQDAGPDCLATLTAGVGSCQVIETSTSGSPDSITANYEGDTNDGTSSSAPIDLTVLQAATTTTMSAPLTAVVGQPITVGVSVAANAPGAGTPTGTVTVSDGTQTCPAPLNLSGVGSCQITETSVVDSPYSFTASYAGDSNYLASVASGIHAKSVTVLPDATTTTITGTTASPVVGQPITIGVSVTANAPGSGIPSSTVTVSDATRNCVATLDDGVGSCQITETAAGPYSFTASYAGDSNDDVSTTAIATPVSVEKDLTTTTMAVETGHPVVGQPITVNVSTSVKSPGAGTPTKTVTVSDGVSGSCVATLSSGTGSCAITEATAGGYEFSATYNGDGNDAASTSANTGVTVAKATSATTLGVSPSKVTYGDEQAARFSVTVSPEFGGTPGGTVAVTEGTVTLCTITLSSGGGSCEMLPARVAVSTYHAVATYEGSGDFATSASGAETLTVEAASSKTALSLSKAKVSFGDEQIDRVDVTVSPQYAGTTPTGTVTVKAGSTELCTARLSDAKGTCTWKSERLNAGVYHVTASYGGSSDFKTSTSAVRTMTIVRAGTTSAFGLSTSRVTYGGEGGEHFSVAVSPAYRGISPTGQVVVRTGGSTLCVIRLSSGRGGCSLSPTELGAGGYGVTAYYEGDSDFVGSGSGTRSLSITRASTATALRLSASRVSVGGEGSEHVSVSVSGEFGLTPGGSVTVRANGAKVCVIGLARGRGSCTLAAERLNAGHYHLTASYGGSSDFGNSGSPSGSLTVAKAKTSSTLKLSTAKVNEGSEQSERISVSVSGQFGVRVNGSVQVTASGTTVCVITLSAGRGSCKLSPSQLSVGNYQVVASYGGGTNFDSSLSAPQTLVVKFVLSVG